MKHRIRSSAVLLHNNSILTFLGVDPHDGRQFYFLPGGVIDPGETAPEAAERETFEETGYKVKVDTSSALDKEYTFHWNGEDVHCFTVFYLAQLVSPFQAPQVVKDVDYNKGVVWIPRVKAREIFSYSPEICDAVLELIGEKT